MLHICRHSVSQEGLTCANVISYFFFFLFFSQRQLNDPNPYMPISSCSRIWTWPSVRKRKLSQLILLWKQVPGHMFSGWGRLRSFAKQNLRFCLFSGYKIITLLVVYKRHPPLMADISPLPASFWKNKKKTRILGCPNGRPNTAWGSFGLGWPREWPHRWLCYVIYVLPQRWQLR